MANPVTPVGNGTPFEQELHDILPGGPLNITSDFFVPRTPPMSDPHVGVDIQFAKPVFGKNKENPPVYAPVTGYYHAGSDAYGAATIVDGYGLKHTILHLSSRVHFKDGQVVTKGTQIGTEGATGAHGAYHVHYEIEVTNQTGSAVPQNEIHVYHGRRRFINPRDFWNSGMGDHEPALTPEGSHAGGGGAGAQKKAKKKGFPPNSPPSVGNPARPAPATPAPPAPGDQPPAPPPAPAQPAPNPPSEDNFFDRLLKFFHMADNSKTTAARYENNNIMATTGPDVLKTPISGKMVPVAYNSVAVLDPSVRVATSVFINGRQDFYLNSRSAKIEGHEKGTGKGVQYAGYKLYSHAKTASAHVYSEGWAEVRDGDPAWINHPDIGPTEPSRPMTTVQIASVWPSGASTA